MKTKCISRFVVLHVLFAPALPAGAAGPITGEKAIQHLKDTGQYESLAAAMTGARYVVQPVQNPEGLTRTSKWRTTEDTEGIKVGTAGRPHQKVQSRNSSPALIPCLRYLSWFQLSG